MNSTISSTITVIPPTDTTSDPPTVRQDPSSRRKSSFPGEFMEYTGTLSDLQKKILIIKQTSNNLRPSTLDFAKKNLIHEQQQKSHFEEKLRQMRETDKQLSQDPKKSHLAGHFQLQLKTLIMSTEKHLLDYDTALKELDRNIRRSLLAQDEKQHPPLARQTAQHALQSVSTWQKICSYFKRMLF